MQETVKFPSGAVNYLFHQPFEDIWQICDKEHTVIVTDEHVSKQYASLFRGLKTLVIPPGEHSKDLSTIGSLARQLLDMEATRRTTIVGVGGGSITDITGFLASVYMRGVSFGFAPTTLLGMVDAAIGGKNGVNLGFNKNIIGTISQPSFILHDPRFLDTLPDDEWSNGFAEIIKYACIFDSEMFAELDRNNITHYKDHDDAALWTLIKKCLAWKCKTVMEDEKETGVRRLLNFGHTAAHAIENLYEIPHGKAVGIGMVIASMISSHTTGLERSAIDDLRRVLGLYHLPVRMKIDARKAMEILRMDKKRSDNSIDYILLERIGKAVIRALPLTDIEKALASYESNN